MDAVRAELCALSRSLGDPGKELAILAEGNASTRVSPETFLVKASGFSLADLPNEGLIEVEFAPILNAMATQLNDDEVRQVLKGSRVDQTSPLLPSVETFMHAWLLTLPGVAFVGHTHPTSLLSLLCLADAEQIARQRLFPDEIVLCGPESCFVKYVDPGLPLAAEIAVQVREYIDRWGEVPRTIWLQNHGLITLGSSPAAVEGAMRMAEKAARVWRGVLSTGRPVQPLTPDQVSRIHTRPDEHYRQRLLAASEKLVGRERSS